MTAKETGRKGGNSTPPPPGLQPSVAQAEVALKTLFDEETRKGGANPLVALNAYFGLTLCKLDLGIAVPSDGLYWGSDTGDDFSQGKGYRGRMGPLFTIIGTGVDPAKGEETRVIEFRDAYKRVRQIVIPLTVIHQGGHHLGAHLAAKGFDAPVGKKPRAALQAILSIARGPRIHIAGSTGWVSGIKEPAFVLPDRIVGEHGDTRVVADSGAFANLKIAQCGTMEDWQDRVAAKARGNSRLTLALSAAFASSLLRFAPTTTPTVLHLYADSSVGKTSTLMASGSVWGGADGDALGFAQSWNATSNYILAIAAAHSDTVLILDELRTASAPDVVKAAYTLAGGQGRGRLTKDAQRRGIERFRTITLSTGELTLDEIERQASGPKQQAFAGAEMRLPSIPADAGKGFGSFEDIHKFANKPNGAAKFADALQSAARSNYGHAGPRFIEEMVEEITDIGEEEFRKEIAAMVREFAESVELEEAADDAVKRLLRTFGLIAAAGQLACRWKILPLSEDDIGWGVATCFKAWIGARGGARSKTANTALIELRDFLQSNVGRFIPVNADELPKIANVAGYVETRDGSTVYYILPPTWKHAIISKAPRAKLIEALDQLDLLIRKPGSTDDTLVKKIRILGKSVRAYAVDGAILELTDQGTLEPGATAPIKDGGKVAYIEEHRRTSNVRQARIGGRVLH